MSGGAVVTSWWLLHFAWTDLVTGRARRSPGGRLIICNVAYDRSCGKFGDGAHIVLFPNLLPLHLLQKRWRTPDIPRNLRPVSRLINCVCGLALQHARLALGIILSPKPVTLRSESAEGKYLLLWARVNLSNGVHAVAPEAKYLK
jgi:hypothetical protein